MSHYHSSLEKWHKFVAEGDAGALEEALAEQAVFHSPFVWTPKEGKAIVMLYLTSAVQVLQEFQYHRQFVSDDSVALEFSATVGGLTVKGVDLIQFDQAGKISDFEVMVRPGNGLQALANEMSKQLTLKAG